MDYNQQNLNVIILESLPIDRKLKKYYANLFLKMVKENGSRFACDRFKQLKESLMGYKADRSRSENRIKWMRKSGMKICGRLKQLFNYCDTQPEYILQFVKLYCGPNKPITSTGKAAYDQHQRLYKTEATVDTRTPNFLTLWLRHICHRNQWFTVFEYAFFKSGLKSPPNWMSNFIEGHSHEEYIQYCSLWRSRLWVKPLRQGQIVSQLERYIPTVGMYADIGHTENLTAVSPSLDMDLWQFIAMQEQLKDSDGSEGTVFDSGLCGLSYESWDFVAGLMDDMMSIPLGLDEEAMCSLIPEEGASMLDGTYVGQIHHIPKSGTVDRRSIAAPNRFLQWGMAVIDRTFSIVLKRLGQGAKGRDCTYDQSHCDAYIQNRVNNDSLYAGSVDLSKATDNLPFEWFITIFEEVFAGHISESEEASWKLFCDVSRGKWLNEGYRSEWTVGQPLGCIPSFRVLGLTHNLLLESLAFTLGYGHSPYCVLGDDVIIMSKKLRKGYITLMNNCGVPLSLHKSYVGGLVEFAGKLYIPNLAPFYNTDQREITWNSLYDYQWATGVFIDYGHLPAKLRKKVSGICQRSGLPRSVTRSVYELAYYSQAAARGSHMPKLPFSRKAGIRTESDVGEILSDVALLLEKEGLPDLAIDLRSGLEIVVGHPISYGKREYTNHNGWWQAYRPLNRDWFKTKYRPVATDIIVNSVAIALAQRAGRQKCPSLEP